MMCAFPGCPNPKSPKAAKGLCNSHYWQLHKGRELTPLSYRRNVTEPWLMAHVDHDGDDCLTWPFQTNDHGYGMVRYSGYYGPASRVMCELVNGPPPTPDHEAAHSCGKGHLGCVNPNHLRWATRLENVADMLEHGTRPRGERQGSSKLKTSDVLAIRALAGKASHGQIGAMFGIAQSHAGRIIRGERWGHI